MTISEFKAWVEGFREAIGDAPTAEQWQRIIAKLSRVYDSPTPLPVLPYAPISPSIPWRPTWTICSTDSIPLDAASSAAIFADVEGLYEN